MRQLRFDRRPFPYEVVAAALREQIDAGEIADGGFLPGIKVLAAAYGVAVGTAFRAVKLLIDSSDVTLVSERGKRRQRVERR